jgi:hypothetical protein
MTEQDNDQFDFALRDYFRDSLEGQQGRAGEYFHRYLKSESKALWRQRSFLIGTFISGLAASVAVLWATPIFHQSAPPSKHVESASVIQPVIERLVSSQTSDEGVVMLDDDTPVRVFHRQSIEQTRWFDEHEKVEAQELTPRDDVVFVKLATY